MRVCFVSDACRLRRQIFGEMKGKTEKILCGFSSIFPKYLEKYARKMRAGRYETGSEGKFASRWRAKSPDALCAVLPFKKSRDKNLCFLQRLCEPVSFQYEQLKGTGGTMPLLPCAYTSSLPSLAVSFPVMIRIRSISHQIPKPPAVISFRIPKPVYPR